MTAEQRAYLQALSDVRSGHRWQIGQSIGEVRLAMGREVMDWLAG